jgi:hypothetical protein
MNSLVVHKHSLSQLRTFPHARKYAAMGARKYTGATSSRAQGECSNKDRLGVPTYSELHTFQNRSSCADLIWTVVLIKTNGADQNVNGARCVRYRLENMSEKKTTQSRRICGCSPGQQGWYEAARHL